MTKIIAITGMDGCGKSTVMESVLNHFPSSVSAEIWQPMYGENSPFSSKKAVDNYICSLSPNARTLFLAHALQESTSNALLKEVDYVFLNAYYFKYFASEMALGASESLINSLIQQFEKPHLTIELTTPIDTILLRKNQFSRYESGLVETPSSEAFSHFQAQCKERWQTFDRSNFKTLSNQKSFNETLESVIQLIEKL